MAVQRKRKNGTGLDAPAPQDGFLILEDTAANVYIVGSGALGKPVKLTAELKKALGVFKQAAGNQPILNVSFAALIEQSDALLRLFGNAHKVRLRD